MKKENTTSTNACNTEETFNRDLMKDFISEIINGAPGYRIDDVAEELTNELCEAYCKMVRFPKVVNTFNPMKIGAIIEENAKSSKIDHNIQELMFEHMSDLESYYHKELYESEEEVESRVAMLDLAETVLLLGYGIDLRLNNMIESEHQFALDMATFRIRNECKKYVSSKGYLEYLKKHNIAFIQDDDHIIIQLLTGSFSPVDGYEYGHMLSADGVCLDPSMKGWDMIMFLMYT